MIIDYKNYIGIFKNVYPAGYCQHVIDEFERLCKNGAGTNRQQAEKTRKHVKDDTFISLNIKDSPVSHFKVEEEYLSVSDIFFTGLQACYDEYSSTFSILNDFNIFASHMKMQKTFPVGGYHVWHQERGPAGYADRALVYTLYLNTLNPEDGGETEYLYEKVRLSPEENTMIIWPADFTHTHRGNLVLGKKSKYIITGWFYYDR